MPRTSIVFTGKEQLELRQEDVPPATAGTLLIKTTVTLISNGTERIVFTRDFDPKNHWGDWVKYPLRIGYLQTGVVQEVGEGVRGWNVGDRVATRCLHTSHQVIPEKAAFHIPADVSDDDAVWMGLGKITQVGVRAADHKLGDSVVVVGLGMLGQLVVQYVRLLGAKEIVGIDMVPMRLEMARKHGATRVIQATAAAALSEVMAATGGRGADVVYDVTGYAPVFATALPLVRKFGTLVLLGDTGLPAQQALTGDVVIRGLKIVGAHDSHPPAHETDRDLWTSRAMMELFLTYLARRQMATADLITHRFTPNEAPRAYEMLTKESRSIMGLAFDWP